MSDINVKMDVYLASHICGHLEDFVWRLRGENRPQINQFAIDNIQKLKKEIWRQYVMKKSDLDNRVPEVGH